MKASLSELEDAVLLIVGILAKEAYPVNISEELYRKTSRRVAVGAVHSALVQLERRGFAVSVIVESGTAQERRRKRVYSVTTYGQQKNNLPHLKETMEDFLLMYHACDHVQALKNRKLSNEISTSTK